MAESDRFLDVTFSPGADMVSVVRRFVLHFCRQTIDDGRLTSRVSVASHEMLENAVRYAEGGVTRIRVEFNSGPDGDVITIWTWNRASPERVSAVDGMIAAMASADDPDSYYRSLMVRSAKVPGSGLGLGRIFAETDMNVCCSMDGDLLVIQAQSRSEKGARQ